MIAGSSVVLGSAEHLTSHLQQRRVVVPRLVAATPKRGQGLAEEREGLCLDLEAQHVARRRGQTYCRGLIPRSFAGHELLELPQRLAVSELQPLLLGVGHGYPRQLARSRPAELSGVERMSQARQLLECLGDA